MTDGEPIYSIRPSYSASDPEQEHLLSDTRGSVISLPSPSGGFIVTPKRQLSRRPKSFSAASEETIMPFPAMSINNPLSHDRRLSSLLNLDQLYERLDAMRHMRSIKLIGAVPEPIQWLNYYKHKDELKKLKNKQTVKFYSAQNEMIERYTAVDKLLESGIHISMLDGYNTSNAEDGLQFTNPPANIDLEGGRMIGFDSEENVAIIDLAIKVNFAINVVLLVSKVVVVYFTKSVSIIASLVDSALDFLSTLVIFFSNKYASSQSARFPIGRKRLEPLGVLVLSVIIIISFVQVLQEAVNRLIWGHHEIVKLNAMSIEIMALTITAKIICFCWCRNISNSSVQALAEDSRTDVVFNFFSILFPFLGVVVGAWWADSLGALLLSLYVIIQWCLIALEHINNLTGANASKEDYQEILYLVTRFSENITKVREYRAYHVGDLVNVEVDIVIGNTSLTMRDCHDLAESLQYAIETLPVVERAFVHIDYRVRNFKGHLN
ncbi:uncharacterized protein OGAPODRAFT_16461 [Ogataea polymorpha]|uniref:uncharacterized protein n=1 Tax=Ogataea polymorpha TaxID=460523 RepID=UPI0007F515CF|nr:uncharacterized protein OGAPODRAFT_16461 [Ogataea polymorpha]KAG7894084.1 hypothetical protein KL908_002361 [Ogataea polymorpha]KAG7931585.1 hypothetical protein KL934_003997 [Ogataea polymorpha]OBA15546.1 hypothetical protein OGAPODRAFT_16461 [Ogataea polymorpha]